VDTMTVIRGLLPMPNGMIGRMETMTKEERQALREKHSRGHKGDAQHCNHCDWQAYPCDVIKVLDRLDFVDPMNIELIGAQRDWAKELEKFKKKMEVSPTVYSLDVPPESAGNPITDELPWAYRDWSYEVEKSNKQEPPHDINWAGGK